MNSDTADDSGVTRLVRRLKVDLTLLEGAFETDDSGVQYYLDTTTGEVLLTTEDTRFAWGQVNDGMEEGIDFATAVARSDMPQWEKDAALDVERIEDGYGETVFPVPVVESRDAFRDMEDFARTVSSQRLADRLDDALRGSRPFRRFKDAVYADSAENDRWHAFSDARVRERVLDWLAELGIEPIE